MLKGYSYTVTREQIRRHMSLTPEQKLEWLEEANGFVDSFMTEQSRRIRDKLRRGEL
ncbi:MAG: hypothetical protein ACYC5A_10895 [Thermoleophilia bacterium]